MGTRVTEYTDLVKLPCIMNEAGTDMLVGPLECAQMDVKKLRLVADALDGRVLYVTYEASYFFATTQLCSKTVECSRPVKKDSPFCGDHQ